MSQNASFLLGSALGGVLAVTPGLWLVYGMDEAGSRLVRAADAVQSEPA